MSSEDVHLYLATGLHKVGPGGGDAHEHISVHTVALSQLPSWIEQQGAHGKRIDIKLYAGLYFVEQSLRG